MGPPKNGKPELLTTSLQLATLEGVQPDDRRFLADFIGVSYASPVPSQRAKNKKVVSVSMEDDLIAAIERFAASKGWNRTKAIKFMCRKVLGLKMPED